MRRILSFISGVLVTIVLAATLSASPAQASPAPAGPSSSTTVTTDHQVSRTDHGVKKKASKKKAKKAKKADKAKHGKKAAKKKGHAKHGKKATKKKKAGKKKGQAKDDKKHKKAKKKHKAGKKKGHAKHGKKHKKAKKAKKKHHAPLALRALAHARTRAGASYRYGATGPSSFDCSGLTQWAYARAGKMIPRTSSAQAAAAKRVRSPRLGDLVFFHSGGRVYHVGLYAGNGDVFHASRPGTPVGRAKIWTRSVFYGRV